MVSFKGKIWRTGNSWVVTVPKTFVEGNIMSPEQDYKFEVQEDAQDED